MAGIVKRSGAVEAANGVDLELGPRPVLGGLLRRRERSVPKLLFTPILSEPKENIGPADLSTARAPAGWEPR